MHIEKLIIKGLYGYIDKTINFNEDITLLVGINGSGKTSILNIINWILKPSIPNLCVTEFKYIQLFFHFRDIHYEILCKHNKTSFKYYLKTKNDNFNPLNVRITTPPSAIKNDDVLKLSLIQQYSSLSPDYKEIKTWNTIESFPNPTVIGLDRNLYAEESENLFIEDSIRSRVLNKKAIQNNSPLDKVKELVNKEYRKQKNSILNLTSDLKNYLMLSTFNGSITIDSFTSGIRHKLNITQIEIAENRVNDYFKNFENKQLNDEEQKNITNYFHQLKEITIKYQKKPSDEIVKLLYGLNASQFVKVNKLLKEFEKFEVKASKALELINKYIETLNYFFKDSAKKLLFNEETAELSFHTLDRNGNVVTKYNDIKFLSSGEQQILILFSYIAFNSHDGKLFIIDEPELSLHIKWQEDFLCQLDNITPRGTQLILATHSPILANKKRQNATVLMPFN